MARCCHRAALRGSTHSVLVGARVRRGVHSTTPALTRACTVAQMDDHSVCKDGKWSKERYDDIVSKLTPFLKGCGYSPTKDFVFLPIAALSGGNILSKPDPAVCGWWDGSTLFELLDATEPPTRDPMASFRMPVMDKYKDMGTIVMGKSESGVIQARARLVFSGFCVAFFSAVARGAEDEPSEVWVQVGHSLALMPNGTRCKVTGLWRDDNEVQACGPGENLKVRLSGIDEDQVHRTKLPLSRFPPDSCLPISFHTGACSVIRKELDVSGLWRPRAPACRSAWALCSRGRATAAPS